MPVEDVKISVGADTTAMERDINAAMRKLSSSNNGFRLDSSSYTRPLGEIRRAADDFEKSLSASNARVIAFGASAGVIMGVQRAFASLVRSTIDVEKALTDINVLLNLNQNSLKDFGGQLFQIARDTGQAFGEVSKAATEFARQGLSVSETLKRTKDALVLVRLTGLDAKSAVDDITAAINSFNKSALDSTALVNKLATVDAAFAVSSADLAEAIKRVGSTAQDAGVGINELIGIVTSAQQTTARGGAVIGTALKTIFSKISNPEVLDQLDMLGVSVRDASQHMLPAIQILGNLAGAMNNLGPAQKYQIEKLVASQYQINILKASLGDLTSKYSVYGQAVNVANNATDEAVERNKRLNQTLAALVNSTAANLTQSAANVGNAVFGPVTKRTLGAVNSVLEALNSGETDNQALGAGQILGKSILDGIGQFLSGPGTVLIGGVLAKLFTNIAQFAVKAGESFLGINKAMQDQVGLQALLEKMLAGQPELIARAVSGTEGQLAVQQRLLTTLTEEIAIRREIAKMSSGMASAALAEGFTFNAANKLDRKIPNMADPVRAAIQRELGTGVSISQIGVGVNSALVSPFNPTGLGVYNKIDEPGGLAQGVARAAMEGRNPKTYNVPNFAPTRFGFEDIASISPLGQIRNAELNRIIEELKDQFRRSAVSIAQFNDAINDLSKTYRLDDESTKKLEKTKRGILNFIQGSGASHEPLGGAMGIASSYSNIGNPATAGGAIGGVANSYLLNVSPRLASPILGGVMGSSTGNGAGNPMTQSGAAMGALNTYLLNNAKVGGVAPSIGFMGRLNNTINAPGMSNKLLLGSIGADIGASYLANLVGDETYSGRQRGAWARGLGDVAGFGLMGASFGGWGAIGGVAAGLGKAGYGIYQSYTDRGPDITANLNDSRTRLSSKTDAFTRARTISEQIKAARRGELALSPQEEQNLMDEYRSSLYTFGGKTSRSIHEAFLSGDDNVINQLQSGLTREDSRLMALSAFESDLSEGKKTKNSGSNLAKQLMSLRGKDGKSFAESPEMIALLNSSFTPARTITKRGGWKGGSVFKTDVPDTLNTDIFGAGLGQWAGMSGDDLEQLKYALEQAQKRGEFGNVIKNVNATKTSLSGSQLSNFAPTYDPKKFAQQTRLALMRQSLYGDIAGRTQLGIRENSLSLRRDGLSPFQTLSEEAAINRFKIGSDLGSSVGADILNGDNDIKKLSPETGPKLAEAFKKLQEQADNLKAGTISIDGFSRSLEEFDQKTSEFASTVEKLSIKNTVESIRNKVILGKSSLFEEKMRANTVNQILENRTSVQIGTNAFLGGISNSGSLAEFTAGRGIFGMERGFSAQNIRGQNQLSLLNGIANPREFELLKLGAAQTQIGQNAAIAYANANKETGASIFSDIGSAYGSFSERNKGIFKGTIDDLRRTAGDVSIGAPNALTNLQLHIAGLEGAAQAGGKDSIEQSQELIRKLKEVYEARLRKNQEIADLEAKEKEDILLQYKLNYDITQKRKIEAASYFNKGDISGETYRGISAINNQNRIAVGEYRASDALVTLGDQFKYNSKDFYSDLERGAIELGATMKASFHDAFSSFLDGTKTAKEALRGVGISILSSIATKVFDMGISQIAGGVMSGIGAIGSSFGKANGGLIKGYSSGGPVLGGSGMKDDVPAMLSDGEFVIKKSAVNKYGVGFLNRLNMASGGRASVSLLNDFSYNDPNRPTGGAMNVDPSLSNYALSNEDSPENARRMGKEAALYQYIKEAADYKKMTIDARALFDRQQRQRVTAGYVAAGVSLAGSGVSAGVKYYGSPSTTSFGNRTYQGVNPSASYAAEGGYAMNGAIRHFAAGGLSYGGDSTSDTIPAMLMGGEFVVRKQAVDKHGVGFLNQINNGTLRMADGGSVGDYAEGSTSQRTGHGDSASRLLEIVAKIQADVQKAISNKPGSPAKADDKNTPTNGGITINTNISVAANGDTKSDTKSSGKSGDTDEQKGRKLGDMIQAVVLKTINEQKRPGGLLAA